MSNKSQLTRRQISRANKLARAAWNLVWLLLYRPSPIPFHGWRRFLLRLFGAKLANDCCPYPSARIWAPWNLIMREHSCLSHFVDCYCVDKVEVGAYATVSQYSYLCTASHDYQKKGMPLVSGSIVIGPHAWVAADVFIGPGVEIGEGVVVGARSSVFRDVAPWLVVAGSPVRKIGSREQPSV